MHSPCIILTPPCRGLSSHKSKKFCPHKILTNFKLIGAQKPWTINDASDITIFDNSVSIDGA